MNETKAIQATETAVSEMLEGVSELNKAGLLNPILIGGTVAGVVLTLGTMWVVGKVKQRRFVKKLQAQEAEEVADELAAKLV